MLLTLVSVTTLAMAQTGNGIEAATTEIKTYITPIITLSMAIGGIVGLIGGIRIYQKWNAGDQDVQKELMGWGGSCIFLIVAPLVIKGFFGL